MGTVGEEQKLLRHSKLRKWHRQLINHRRHRSLEHLCRCQSLTFLHLLLVRLQTLPAQLKPHLSKSTFLHLRRFQRRIPAF